MHLLNKFAKVQIDHSKSILKGEDLEYCSNLENRYVSAFNFYETNLEFLIINKEENEFLNFDGMIEAVSEGIDYLNKSFIQMIVWYFTNKYKITIGYGDIQEKIFPEEKSRKWSDREDRKLITIESIQSRKISLKTIMTYIQDELGGLTLDEKAETEIKDKFYNAFCKRYHKDKLELVKNRIEFEHTYFSFDSWVTSEGIKFNYNCDASVLNFFQGLSFFESNSSTLLPQFNKICGGGRHDQDWIFSDIEFGLEKIKSVRFYKNSKVVVKFQSEEVANEFYKVMCRSGV